MVPLAQIPVTIILMDIVVAYIPTKFRMFLSRSWVSKLGGVPKLDFTYAIIPIFGGQERRLYRESRFVNTIKKQGISINCLVYSQGKDFSCFMLEVNDEIAEDT